MKHPKPLPKIGKKGRAWIIERKAWFASHPQEYYICHYCTRRMDQQNTTLDHENNRNHSGRILPCCWLDNSKKGSISHDKYVAKYYPEHICEQS